MDRAKFQRKMPRPLPNIGHLPDSRLPYCDTLPLIKEFINVSYSFTETARIFLSFLHERSVNYFLEMKVIIFLSLIIYFTLKQ
jgi:hypothetical protein